MDLVEGISNEVLFAFIVTILLIVIAVFYTFFSEGTGVILSQSNIVDGSINNRNTDEPINRENADETRDNISRSQPETNATDSSRANTTREETSNLPDSRDSEDATEQATPTTREGNVRRRVVNDPDSRQEQSTDEQDETMVVKVKHNENIQTFNVSKNITVIELKR